MRVRFWMVAGLGSLLAAVAACAADGAETSPEVGPSPDADPGPPAVPPPSPADAGGASDGGDAAADGPLPCSEAGWCATSVPDPAIRFYALVPFEKKAFALAWVAGRTTPLVFDGSAWNAIANDHWVASPKNEQVLYALAVPNEHEIWVGGAHGYLAHGVDTSGAWVWTVEDIGTRETVQSIFVASDRDIFVTTRLHVLRKGPGAADAGDGGRAWTIDLEAPPLNVEYGPDSVGLAASFRAVVGSGPDDVWAVGQRANCGYLAHRTAEGWSVFIDSIGAIYTPLDSPYCMSNPDTISVNYLFGAPVVPKPGYFIALYDDYASELQILAHTNDDGSHFVDTAPLPVGTKAVWQAPESEVVYAAGFGAVLWNADRAGGGDWQVSTVSLDGELATLRWFRTIGGVSEKNMWVAGESYALHRTLP